MQSARHWLDHGLLPDTFAHTPARKQSIRVPAAAERKTFTFGFFNPSSLNVDFRPLHGALCPTESLLSRSTLFLLLLFTKKMLK